MHKIIGQIKPVYFVALFIFGLAACQTAHVKTAGKTSFGGGFPDKENATVAPKSEIATSERTFDKTETASETVFSDELANNKVPRTGNKITAYRALRSLKHFQFAPQTDSTATTPPAKKPMEPTANIGFWLVIGGLLTSFIPYVFIISGPAILAGFVLGIIGLSKIKHSNEQLRGRGKAIAAIVIPAVLFLLAILYVFLVILIFASLF